jgi:Cu2+-exporting ATPase
MAVCSRHPYAKAVVTAARDSGLQIERASDVEEVSGHGLVRLTSEGEERLGSARWCGVTEGAAGASLWYRRGSVSAVPFPLEDTLRPDAALVVSVLKKAGWPVVLLSGDRTREVERVAEIAGIDTHLSACLPTDKVQHLEALSRQGRKVLMVGDGLNDAPALAAAHASLSPSTAADISQTASDAVFQGQELVAVIETIAVARASRRMSLENFAIAIGYNAVFVPLAVLGYVTPLIAAIAMSASSIAVTVNALRLRSRKLQLGSWRSSR